jgi:hypothetical protein
MDENAHEHRRRLRAQLFEDLRNGHRDGKEFNPDEAERIAAELGLEPLNPLPDPRQFDPHRLSHFSLFMAIAWIAWRDLDRVRAFDNDYRRQHKRWMFREAPPRRVISREPGRGRRIEEIQSNEPGGWWLEDMKDASLYDLKFEALHRSAEPHHLSISDALASLWVAASDGKISGEAIRVADNTVVDIPSREWRLLKPREDSDLRAGPYGLVVDLSMEPSSLTSMYGAVAFPRATLLQLWPARGASPSSSPNEMATHLIPDVLTSTRWPIECVVARRYAQLCGMSNDARDDLVRAAAVLGQKAIDASYPLWFETLCHACRDILDRAASDSGTFALRDREGNIVRFGASAQLHVHNTSFALYFDQARDVNDRVDGLWCLAAEVRAAWPDDGMQIDKPATYPTSGESFSQDQKPTAVGTTRGIGANLKRGRAGRRELSGPYDENDALLVEEMQTLMNRPKKPLTRYAAAQEVAGRAEGSTNGDSKARRLERKHKKKYPDLT